MYILQVACESTFPIQASVMLPSFRWQPAGHKTKLLLLHRKKVRPIVDKYKIPIFSVKFAFLGGGVKLHTTMELIISIFFIDKANKPVSL